jgi:hypothetical protein
MVYSHGASPAFPSPANGILKVPDRTDWRPVVSADLVGVHWASTV